MLNERACERVVTAVFVRLGDIDIAAKLDVVIGLGNGRCGGRLESLSFS
jgi:hypothetical protein